MRGLEWRQEVSLEVRGQRSEVRGQPLANYYGEPGGQGRAVNKRRHLSWRLYPTNTLIGVGFNLRTPSFKVKE